MTGEQYSGRLRTPWRRVEYSIFNKQQSMFNVEAAFLLRIEYCLLFIECFFQKKRRAQMHPTPTVSQRKLILFDHPELVRAYTQYVIAVIYVAQIYHYLIARTGNARSFDEPAGLVVDYDW